jgi:integrase
MPWLDDVVRARRSVRLPVVLTRDEVRAVIRQLRGTPRLMAILLYGSGLRLLECARLRVKDIDFPRHQITIRAGKGDKDRVTPLPAVVRAELAQHLEAVRELHDVDLRQAAGWVELPWALARKYPNAGREWGWQWVFPATRLYVHRETVSGAATTCTNRWCKEPSRTRSAMPASRSAPPATRSATPLPLTCSRTTATFGRSRSF